MKITELGSTLKEKVADPLGRKRSAARQRVAEQNIEYQKDFRVAVEFSLLDLYTSLESPANALRRARAMHGNYPQDFNLIITAVTPAVVNGKDSELLLRETCALLQFIPDEETQKEVLIPILDSAEKFWEQRMEMSSDQRLARSRLNQIATLTNWAHYPYEDQLKRDRRS